MFADENGENAMGLGCLIILNLHFVFEVVLVIVQMMLIRSSDDEGLHKSFWLLGCHSIVWICLLAAFFAIFNDKPLFILPQILLQICVTVVATLNVFSWIYLSHVHLLVFTELRNDCSPKTNENYVFLYVKILMGCLFVVLYYCSLLVVCSYYRKLRRDAKYKKSISKLMTISEDIIL